MQRIIQDNLNELASICRRRWVRRLELFGSAAGSDFDPATSDLDFLVEFLPIGSGSYFDNYFNLLDDLQALFGRPVDLVTSPAIKNRYFLESVNRNRRIVYAA